MGKNVQFPGGNTTQESAVTGLDRQVRVNTDRHSLIVHDGQKQGGYEIPNLEYIENLFLGGGLSSSGDSVNVVKIFNSEAELKDAEPSLSMLAVVREAGLQDMYLWQNVGGDSGDIASNVSGSWRRVNSVAALAISFWRAGMFAMQIGGTVPVANQSTTAWLSAGVLKLWDGANYINSTPATFTRLLASIGGYSTGAITIPNRLLAQSFEITNLNNVVESGFYKSQAAATGAPVAGVHSFEHRELTNALAIQLFYPQGDATRNHWVRYRTSAGVWGTWTEVAGALPTRLAATAVVITDANAAVESGFYRLDTPWTNSPAATLTYLQVIRASASYISQYAITDGGIFAYRKMSASVWSGWAVMSTVGHTHDDRYYTESEANALLAGKAAAVHTHDDRYYTEAEVTSLLAAKMPANPGVNDIGAYRLFEYAGAFSVVVGNQYNSSTLPFLAGLGTWVYCGGMNGGTSTFGYLMRRWS